MRDLQQISNADPDAGALIKVALQELRDDPDARDYLTDHGFGSDRNGRFGIKKWTRLWNLGLDIWRLRCWQLEDLGLNYRIIYAYVRGSGRYVVLAVLPKAKVEYDNDSDPYVIRIRAAYDNL